MSETLLIFILYALLLARIVVHVKPAVVPPDYLRSFNETVDSIVYAGVAALFLIHFVVRSFYIPSESMTHTLEINDYILVNELQYRISRPQRGEIAVFHPPKERYTGDKSDLIKRVVGIEDDVLMVKDGHLWRNGLKLDEPWVSEAMRLENGDANIFIKEPEGHRVAKGCIFMMGDNRNNSQDSRYFGEVPLANYVGRAELIFWPPSRIRILH